MTTVLKKGFDASWGWPDLPTAWAAGYRFICGYLSRDATKNWTPARIAQAQAIGFALLFNWETTINAYQGGFAQGAADAKQANDEADALGVPGNVWIWYSIDTGATADQVRSYFQGVASVGRRMAGGYGGAEIDQLLHEGVVKGWWQANAGSWSGQASSSFPTNPDAEVRQIVGRTLPSPGGSIDEDWLYSTAGLWLAANHPMTPTAAVLTSSVTPDPPRKRLHMQSVLWNNQLHTFVVINGQLVHRWRDQEATGWAEQTLTATGALDGTYEPSILVTGPAALTPPLPGRLHVMVVTAGGEQLEVFQDAGAAQWGQLGPA